MGYGLALTGSGTGGAVHMGVFKTLMEVGLRPDAVAGAGAGGIVTRLTASGMLASQMEQAVPHLKEHEGDYLDPDYSGLLAFMPQLLAGKGIDLPGLIKGDKLLDYFFQLTGRRHMDETVLTLVISAMDLVNGSTIYSTNDDQVREMECVTWEWNGYLCKVMMAGANVPATFPPRRVGRYLLVDRGVTDILPINLLQAAGIRDVLAVDIAGDHGAPSDCFIIEVISHPFSIMSGRLKGRASARKMLLLKPPLSPKAGLLTFEQMGGCIEQGYEYTKKIFPRIHKALNRV